MDSSLWLTTIEFRFHKVVVSLVVVCQTLGQGIHKGIARQVSAFGGDGRQGGNDLVVDGVTSGSGAGVGIGIGFAGVVLILPQGLFQRGDVYLVLSVSKSYNICTHFADRLG